MKRVSYLALSLPLLACSKPHSPAPTVDEAQAEIVDAAPSELPSRCTLSPTLAPMPHESSAGDFELGEYVSAGDGFAAGAIRGANSKRVASVLSVSADGKSVTPYDLGPTFGDSPPPRPFAAPGGLYAAYYPARPFGASGDASRSVSPAIAVVEIRDGHSAPSWSIPTEKDDSLDLDAVFGAAGAVLVWDEDDPKTRRGVIQVAVLKKGPATAARTLTVPASEEADAESPRLAKREGGYWLFFASRRRGEKIDSGNAVDVIAESRTNRWIEGVPLDQEGRRAGPNRRVTPLTAHVTSFVLSPAAGATFDLIARDEIDGADSQNGRILRSHIEGESVPSMEVLVPTGVGRGVPDLIRRDPQAAPGRSSWLSFVDPRGHARLLSLDANGAPAALSSVEPGLEDARVLGTLQPEAGRDRLLVLSPNPTQPATRLALCAP